VAARSKATNHLYYGDNLEVLREHIATESVDLVYLDPPFNSQATYNVLFRSPTGTQSQAQIEAFEDTWHWNDTAERAFDEVMSSGNSDVAEMLRALRSFLKENDMMAYLTMMAIRLLELHRVLKPSGCLYLHCDPSASHYLKILLDGIFGKERFLNEIIWKRTSAHNAAKRYGPAHDVILFFAKSKEFIWNRQHQSYDEQYEADKFSRMDGDGRRWKEVDLTGPGARQGESGLAWRGINPTEKRRHWQPASVLYDSYERKMGHSLADFDMLTRLDKFASAGLIYWPEKEGGVPRGKQYLDESFGVPLQDVWVDINPVNSQSAERLGYPTQKPLSLLDRIIAASSNEGNVVLDPFCGCGTAIHAAQKLRRNWIGIDITHLAISLIEKRLRDAFPGISFEVHGTPKDLGGATALAAADKYQFQWWAVSLVNAVPYGGKKKGADSGIDGYIYFKPDGKTTEKAIVSVKGGESVSVPMIRELAHVVNREKAKIGILISLAEATRPMKTEALKAGYYETDFGKYPRIQIFTIKELFAGNKPNVPLVDPNAFKKAQVENLSKQGRLI
jgi:adenine specific DNA methylase Mod